MAVTTISRHRTFPSSQNISSCPIAIPPPYPSLWQPQICGFCHFHSMEPFVFGFFHIAQCMRGSSVLLRIPLCSFFLFIQLIFVECCYAPAIVLMPSRYSDEYPPSWGLWVRQVQNKRIKNILSALMAEVQCIMGAQFRNI